MSLLFSFQIGLSVIIVLGIIALVVLGRDEKLNELNKELLVVRTDESGVFRVFKEFYNSHQFLKQFAKEK